MNIRPDGVPPEENLILHGARSVEEIGRRPESASPVRAELPPAPQKRVLRCFRWNGRNSSPGLPPRPPRSHPEATLRLSGSQLVGTLKPPSYRFSGLIHRLGGVLTISRPAQPVNKSVRARRTRSEERRVG